MVVIRYYIEKKFNIFIHYISSLVGIYFVIGDLYIGVKLPD
jgi:hypothetical protein